MSGEPVDTDALLARLRELTELARSEDLGQRGDVTGQLLPAGAHDAEYRLAARQAGVLSGALVAGEVLQAYDRRIELSWTGPCEDGMRFEPGADLACIRGPNSSILAAERVLLNFLQRLCGIATATRAYVDAVAGTSARVYDTRKTTPGWRVLDKYAVRCGGGRNHRMGLYDAILIKDNHLADVPAERLATAVFEMLGQTASLNPPPTFVEVEVDTVEQAEQIFKVVGVDLVLLDNFSNKDLRRTVRLRNALGLKGKIELEASGGVSLETVRAIAETGVERISVGAVTHSVTAVDLSLERV
jgi:nicotinate-nucleotide pyrophosphorylase (carboxylating)